LKYNDNGLIFDSMHHFHMKMSLFLALCIIRQSNTVLSTRSVLWASNMPEMEFTVVMFARRPSVTRCARWSGSCSNALT